MIKYTGNGQHHSFAWCSPFWVAAWLLTVGWVELFVIVQQVFGQFGVVEVGSKRMPGIETANGITLLASKLKVVDCHIACHAFGAS